MKQELIIDYTENMDELQKEKKYMLWKKARESKYNRRMRSSLHQ
ncbi:hypothetical protein [Wolbachia endosymbiont (group A) of Barypeithes pellucidus]